MSGDDPAAGAGPWVVSRIARPQAVGARLKRSDVEQDLAYQLAYQRGVQAVIWGMPAVSIAALREATFRDLGARDNDVVYMSNVPEPRHELMTASDEAPYVMVMLNLKDGPAVLDVPPAADEVAFAGSAMDSWMVPIADI